MPTYVETNSMRIVVLPDGQRRSGASYREVELDRVLRLGLNDGHSVSPAQLDELLQQGVLEQTGLPAPTPVPPAQAGGSAPMPSRPATKPSLPLSVDEARTSAAIAGGFGYALLILSAVIGLAIAVQTENYSGFPEDDVHPYVWQGIAIGLAGIFQSLLVIMVAKYIQAKMELAKADRGS